MEESNLLDKEQLLQLVMNNIPSFIFWKDRNSVYLGCNMNFALSAGLDDPNKIIGKTDYDLPWSKEESDFFRAVDKRVMDSGKEELNFEEPQTISDGTTRWLRTSKIPLLNAEKEVIGILGTYEDITSKKELELKLVRQAEHLQRSNEHLKRLNYSLEQANIDLEHFAFATSHDLQEPLRMIGSFTSLIRRRYAEKIDEEGQEYFQFIAEGVERMSKLIKGVLNYTRIDKELEEFILSDIQFIIKEKVKDLAGIIEATNTEVIINVPEQEVYCQPVRLGILFYNLILNGIKFNLSDKRKIEVLAEEQNHQWQFTVKDNGIGINPDFKDKIFQPFKRLNTRDKFPGTGIGLSVCKRIVAIHNGEIWFDRNEIDGTNFYFTIPKKPVAKPMRLDTH